MERHIWFQVCLCLYLYLRLFSFTVESFSSPFSSTPFFLLCTHYYPLLRKYINELIYYLITHPESQCLISPWAKYSSLSSQEGEEYPMAKLGAQCQAHGRWTLCEANLYLCCQYSNCTSCQWSAVQCPTSNVNHEATHFCWILPVNSQLFGSQLTAWPHSSRIPVTGF